MSNERICAEIDLSAISYNMESMHRNLTPGTGMIAVVKTDGYGHGACAIAKKIEHLPYLWGFAVATFEEAKELRQAGITKPILILGYVFPYCYLELARLQIRPAVFRADMLEQLAQAGKAVGQPVLIHTAVDTGMSRIGIRPDDTGMAFIRGALALQKEGGIVLEGIFTHFSRADEPELDHTHGQIGRFSDFCERIEKEEGYRIPFRHCSNSAGIIRLPRANFDLVRAKEERLATVPVGYGDGYPRSLSNKGYVLIRGQRAPIRGRVCMDQMMVDVSQIPEAREGDLVTLIGRDGDLGITMEEMGDLSGRFNYELACDISPRVPRVFIDD